MEPAPRDHVFNATITVQWNVIVLLKSEKNHQIILQQLHHNQETDIL